VVERAWFSDRTSTGSLSLARDHILRRIDIQELAETQQYSTLHKIVLGLSKLDLKSQLTESTVDIDALDTLSRTPLWWASVRGDENAVRSLLEHGASLGKRPRNYHSPLHVTNSPAIVNLLLDYGEHVDCRDEVGRTPLHCCAYRGDYRAGSVDLLKALLDCGADVHAQTRAGHTPLHYASMYGYVDYITLLLSRGAFIEARKQNGHTPLMEAIRCGQPRAVNLLLQNRADHMAVSGQGKTILHICASSGDISMFNVLTCARLPGIDVDAKDSRGLTARDYLQQRKDITEGLTTALEELIKSIHQEGTEDIDIGPDHYEDALEEQDVEWMNGCQRTEG
jgi:ankyrin repeat protein